MHTSGGHAAAVDCGRPLQLWTALLRSMLLLLLLLL
jgi:hypothetical protein